MNTIRVSASRSLRLTLVAVGSLCALQSAMAGPFLTDKPFDLTSNVNGVYSSTTDTIQGGTTSATLGFSTVTDLFNQGQNTMTANAAQNAVIRFGYRGTPVVLSSNGGSADITLLIPGLNVNRLFNAQTTRDGNINDVREFLKSSGGDILNQLQKLLVKTSPVDPIAGNPNSMQSRMVSEDFDRNFTQFASNIQSAPATGASSETTNNLIGLGLGYGSYTQAGLSSSVVTLPLSYTTRPDLDPRRQLTLYAPITVTDAGGAKSYGINFGLSYRIPINDEWALTPAAGYGVTGSVDLGSGAAMLAASLTSQYTLQMDGYDLSIGNMAGVYQSSKINVGGYSFDPQINNTVLRNGVMASFPTSIQGKKMAFEVSYVNTLFSGTALYSNQYNEIGVTLGTNKGANTARSYLRGGLSYMVGENDIRGFKANVGYWF